MVGWLQMRGCGGPSSVLLAGKHPLTADSQMQQLGTRPQGSQCRWQRGSLAGCLPRALPLCPPAHPAPLQDLGNATRQGASGAQAAAARAAALRRAGVTAELCGSLLRLLESVAGEPCACSLGPACLRGFRTQLFVCLDAWPGAGVREASSPRSVAGLAGASISLTAHPPKNPLTPSRPRPACPCPRRPGAGPLPGRPAPQPHPAGGGGRLCAAAADAARPRRPGLRAPGADGGCCCPIWFHPTWSLFSMFLLQKGQCCEWVACWLALLDVAFSSAGISVSWKKKGAECHTCSARLLGCQLPNRSLLLVATYLLCEHAVNARKPWTQACWNKPCTSALPPASLHSLTPLLHRPISLVNPCLRPSPAFPSLPCAGARGDRPQPAAHAGHGGAGADHGAARPAPPAGGCVGGRAGLAGGWAACAGRL